MTLTDDQFQIKVPDDIKIQELDTVTPADPNARPAEGSQPK
jgi:hypothetical protein